MVLQDTWLMEGTVRENLVYNHTDVTDEQLERACLGLWDLPLYSKHSLRALIRLLEENIAVSAGQKTAFHHRTRHDTEQPHADPR